MSSIQEETYRTIGKNVKKYDTKGNKRKISFTKQIEGHDKNWVKGTCAAGIILWPLLLFGFVKGGEAKLMPKDEIYATTMSTFEY